MKSEISNDRHCVSVTITGDFSAADLETLIADLATVRANLLPQVSADPPGAEATEQNQHVSVQENPGIAIRLLDDGRIRIWLRNIGLGWHVFNLPVHNACAIRDYLVANTPPGIDGNFFAQQITDRDTSH